MEPRATGVKTGRGIYVKSTLLLGFSDHVLWSLKKMAVIRASFLLNAPRPHQGRHPGRRDGSSLHLAALVCTAHGKCARNGALPGGTWTLRGMGSWPRGVTTCEP